MAHRKYHSAKNSTTKARKYTKRRHMPKKWHKKRSLNIADILLAVILVTLIFVQGIKWFEENVATPVNEPKTEMQEKQAFINQLVPSAQKQQRQYHVFASITLAQAGLESNWGKSELAQKYHNLFGIKSDDPNSPMLTTQEYVNGQWITIKARFASYPNYDDSIAAHTMLFVNGTGWDASHYQAVIRAKSYRQAAFALQSKGYATDPNYAQKLISLIEQYHLQRYDL